MFHPSPLTQSHSLNKGEKLYEWFYLMLIKIKEEIKIYNCSANAYANANAVTSFELNWIELLL